MSRVDSKGIWRQRSVLVTGATGAVGSQLVHRLLDLGANVICFIRDHDPASALWYSGDIERVSVVSGRLEVFEHVKATIVEREIDTVFHLGAQAIVETAARDPLATIQSNVLGAAHVLEACRLYGGVKRIIIASSDKAYGDCDALPYTESTPLAPRNPYDVSKACADLVAQSYGMSYRLPVAIARCGNIFGPGDLNWTRLVPGTIRALQSGQRPVIRSSGAPVRDFLYIGDAVDAYLSLARWLDQREGGELADCAFNFSTGRPLSVLQMTRMIQQACGRGDLDPVIRNEAAGEIAAQHLDWSRAQRELGWIPGTDFEAALRSTVEWYRAYLARFERSDRALSLPSRPTRASA